MRGAGKENVEGDVEEVLQEIRDEDTEAEEYLRAETETTFG